MKDWIFKFCSSFGFCFNDQEKGSDQIVLKAMGRAINKTVMIAELIKVDSVHFSSIGVLFIFHFPTFLLKIILSGLDLCQRRIIGLHQITSIGSTDITDMWEPLEEGLLPYDIINVLCSSLMPVHNVHS